MTTPGMHLAQRAKTLLLLAIATCAVAIAMLDTAAEKASAYWVCGPTGPVTRPADFRCQYGSYRDSINYIEKDSWQRGYAVYRSSTRNGSSISGSEYYSPTANYFIQFFSCAPGYPNAHNRHSVSVDVAYTLAGSC